MASNNLYTYTYKLANNLENLEVPLKVVAVRVADTLHRELTEEAKREGVSLNQLCLTKLARPLDWYRFRESQEQERKVE